MDTSTELGLHQTLEQVQRAIETLAQAKAPLVEQLGHDRRRATDLKVGDVVYVSQHWGWQLVHDTKLGADGDEMVVMVKFVVEFADEDEKVEQAFWHADDFVSVEVPQEVLF